MLGSYRYRGRHRAPSTTGATAVRVAAAGVMAATPLGLTSPAHAGPPGGWDAVIGCESGNRNIEHGGDAGGVSTASGYFQFVNGTWRTFGGTEFAPRAIGATRDQQIVIAERAYAANGLRDWEASRGCWEPKMGRHAADTEAPKHGVSTPPRHAEQPRTVQATSSYTVKPGDTLSGIAATHGTTWPRLYAANRGIIANPDLIFPGQRFHV